MVSRSTWDILSRQRRHDGRLGTATESLQEVTKSYGNSTPSTPSHRRDDDDDDLSLSLGFALHATRSATDGNHHRIFHEEYSGGESGGGGSGVGW